MNLLSRLGHIFDKIMIWLTYFNGVLIFSIILMVSLDILSRNILNLPIQYVDEFSGYSIIYICFLSAPWVLRREGHISVTVVVEQLNPRNRRVHTIIVSILLAMMCLILTYFGSGATLDAYKRGFCVNIGIFVPLFPLMVVIPIGYFLLFIQFVRRTYGVWKLGDEAYKKAAKQEESETIERI